MLQLQLLPPPAMRGGRSVGRPPFPPSPPPHPPPLYPTHPNGAYTCDACGLDGTAASYSCPLCDFDVHVPCALLPQTLENPSAHPHELRLSYALPHHGDKRHVCSICGEDLDYKLWTYDCFGCDFRTHCSCAVAAARRKAAATEEETECGGSGEESNVGGAAQQLLEIHNQAMKHQVEMYKLQVQMEATHQMCKLMSSFNF